MNATEYGGRMAPDVLSVDEERALAVLREIFSSIRATGSVASVRAVCKALEAEGGVANEGDGTATYRFMGAHLCLHEAPGDGGLVEVRFLAQNP